MRNDEGEGRLGQVCFVTHSEAQEGGQACCPQESKSSHEKGLEIEGFTAQREKLNDVNGITDRNRLREWLSISVPLCSHLDEPKLHL